MKNADMISIDGVVYIARIQEAKPSNYLTSFYKIESLLKVIL
jgi:hypothetical protein